MTARLVETVKDGKVIAVDLEIVDGDLKLTINTYSPKAEVREMLHKLRDLWNTAPQGKPNAQVTLPDVLS